MKIKAEKNTAVAKQKALQAEEEKKAIIAKGEADAAATKLKVAAGLSPIEAAEFEMKTAIGVAQALSGINLPSIMVTGSGKEGKDVDPFTAVGLKALMDISKSMSEGK